MTDSIETRVAQGVALLDERLPDWWHEGRTNPINLDMLNLASPCGCVLGQTRGDRADDYDDPYFMQSRNLFGRFNQDRDAAYGFNVPAALRDVDDEYAELTAEWRRVVLGRRGGVL